MRWSGGHMLPSCETELECDDERLKSNSLHGCDHERGVTHLVFVTLITVSVPDRKRAGGQLDQD